MSALTSKSFWADAVERAIRTVAQAALALLTVSGTDLLTLDWVGLASASALAGIISILMSIVASGTSGDADTASFVK